MLQALSNELLRCIRTKNIVSVSDSRVKGSAIDFWLISGKQIGSMN